MGRIGHPELDDRYEVLKLLDTGGTSQVYLAIDKRINSQWAIKKTKKKSRAVETTMTEVNTLKRLNHPSLPRILDIREDDEYLYTVMDYIPGENLRTILRVDGPQPEEQVAQWGMELCDVMEYLHKNDIIYRDTKPSNIMLTPEGHIKLIDFGIARQYKPHATEDTTSLGTEGYAAPEQYEGKGQSDARTDVFGIGVTLFQLLTDINPATYKENLFSIRLANPSLSSGLDRIILKCTNRSMEKRYQSTRELKDALANYHLYDNENIKKQKAQKRTAKVFFVLSGVCLLLSGASFFADFQKADNKYETLIAETQNQKKIEEAISLKPADKRGYLVLLDSYGDEMSQEELAEFSHVYAEHQGEIKDKDEVSMAAGEKILSSYEEDSLRSKLLMAEPYFKAVSKDYEKYPAANAYVGLADFYRNFILQGDGTIVKEASKKDYEELLSEMNEIINSVSDYKGTEQKNLLLTSSELCLGLINDQFSAMRSQGVNISSIKATVNLITDKAESVDPKIEVTQQKQEKVLALAKEVNATINEKEKKEDA